MVTEEEQSDMELASEMIPVPQVPVQEEIRHEDPINQQVETPPTKKSRTRKKTLHAAIRKQMEFYFSDANLARDRFLGNLVKQDPNVDLDEFLKFNKIRALTEDRDRIAKALKDSTILEVSEDGTKVRRVTPQAVKENSDECTVYVQRLPRDADHEMLSAIFSQYGPVAYISIPKYRQSQNIKGFSFVEFDKPEDAEKCLKAFREKGYELPSETSPNHVLSITTYEKEVAEEQKERENQKLEEDKKSKKRQSTDSLDLNSDEKNKSKKMKKESGEAAEEKCSETENEPEEKLHSEELPESSKRCKKKRKIEEREEVKQTETESKEPKIMKSEGSETEESDHSKKGKKKRKIVEEETEAPPVKVAALEEKSDESSSEKKEDQTEVAKGKKKKNRHKNYRSSEKADATELGLQVMAKKDWKKLRNKYLDLQRSKMRQLKQHLMKPRRNQVNFLEKMKVEKEDKEGKQETKQEGSNSISDLKFTPGLIVKIELEQPCVDVQSFKKEFRSNSSVKYVDVSEGAMTAFVRFDSAEAAKELAAKTVPEQKPSLITDEEEKWYWEKMQADRVEKLSKKVKQNQRGRNKLLKKAEKELGKHIKFDEV